MTRMTSARIAGFTFLFYIAVAFPSMILMGRATGGEGYGGERPWVVPSPAAGSPDPGSLPRGTVPVTGAEK
jgi:hypothetical protein